MAASVMAVLAVGLGFSILSISSVSAATATHLSISASSPQTAGAPFTVTVSMLDATNALATTNLTDTVHFTSSDGAAVLPIDTALVGGTRTLSVTLNTSGSITVSDVTDGTITGDSITVTVSAANTATHFLVSAPASVNPGVPFSFTVQALDSGNNQATYSGTIHFTSSDPSASLPGPTVIDSGVATFTATLETLGNQTITASDGNISGSDTVDVVTAAQNAVHFSVVAPACVTPGVQFAVTVSALNANLTVDTLYTGTVHLSSSDPLAAFSANSQLTSGVRTFLAVLGSSGFQSITATDTVTLITGSTTVSTCQGVVPVQPIIPVASPITTQARLTG